MTPENIPYHREKSKELLGGADGAKQREDCRVQWWRQLGEMQLRKKKQSSDDKFITVGQSDVKL